MKRTSALAPGSLRVLRLIGQGHAAPSAAAGSRTMALSDGEGRAVAVERSLIESLARDGLIARCGSRLALTATGAALLRRHEATADPFQDQHRDLDTIAITLPSGPALATANLAESPLGALMRRKDRQGRPFLAEAEFLAGERLRADYTRAQMLPRLGANWEAPVTSGRRAGQAGELTDAAMAARQRVEAAIAAVGPELAGVLIDVCCFLKGLETVECERGWPVRSAKIVLKSALGVLARHYRPEAGGRANRILAWGAEDFRPSIG